MLPVKPLPFRGHGEDPVSHESDQAAFSIVKTSSLDVPVRNDTVVTAETDTVRRLLGMDAHEDQPLHLRCCSTLSWEDRVMGFLGCFAVGLALSLSSLLSFPMLLVGHPTPFAWKYSVGNCVSLASSAFLVGPRAQWEQMSSPVRLGATTMYIVSILLTMLSALVFQFALLTFLCMIIQFCALGWYCASYIPFGRSCIQACVGRVCCPV
jgi:hypothetical protein